MGWRSNPVRDCFASLAMTGALLLPGQVRPETGTIAPVVTLLSGEARKAIVAAISSGLGQAAWSALGMAARLAGVSMIDGATAFTRMLRAATSAARDWVKAATAALLAA